jgi:hypothetical protein
MLRLGDREPIESECVRTESIKNNGEVSFECGLGVRTIFPRENRPL